MTPIRSVNNHDAYTANEIIPIGNQDRVPNETSVAMIIDSQANARVAAASRDVGLTAMVLTTYSLSNKHLKTFLRGHCQPNKVGTSQSLYVALNLKTFHRTRTDDIVHFDIFHFDIAWRV